MKYKGRIWEILEDKFPDKVIDRVTDDMGLYNAFCYYLGKNYRKKLSERDYKFLDELSPVEVYKRVLSGKPKLFPVHFWTSSKNAEEHLEEGKLKAAEILWYLCEKENIPIKKAPRKLTGKFLTEKKLGGILMLFGGSRYKMIDYTFPDEFKQWEIPQAVGWKSPKGKKIAKDATRWLVDKITDPEGEYKWKFEDIPRKISFRTFEDFNLNGMLQQLYHGSPSKAIMHVFPGKFYQWNFIQGTKWRTSEGKRIAKEAVKWLVEEKLRILENEVPKKLKRKDFHDNKLGGMISKRYRDCVYKAVNEAYPGKYYPWEFTKAPKGIWTDPGWRNRLKKATRQMVEKLEIELDEVPKKITHKILSKYGITIRDVRRGEKWTLYKIFNIAYPGVFKPWQFYSMDKSEYSDKKIRKAIKWMIEEKKEMPLKSISKKLLAEDFAKYGLISYLNKRFGGSLYRAVDFAYPDLFEQKDFLGRKKWKKRPDYREHT